MVRTNHLGKVEVIDTDTGDILTNVRVYYICINASGKVSVELEIKDVELSIESNNVKEK